MGGFAGEVASEINYLLVTHGKRTGLGWVLDSEGSYQCFPDEPRKVRKPDVSFIRRGRLPEERVPNGHVPIAPDLAVEVVSPNDPVYEIDTKVQEYLNADVPWVWVVNPETRTVHIYSAAGTVEMLGEQDELTLPELIASFCCKVGELFSPPAAS